MAVLTLPTESRHEPTPLLHPHALGKKPDAGGALIDFDAIYKDLRRRRYC